MCIFICIAHTVYVYSFSFVTFLTNFPITPPQKKLYILYEEYKTKQQSQDLFLELFLPQRCIPLQNCGYTGSKQWNNEVWASYFLSCRLSYMHFTLIALFQLNQRVCIEPESVKSKQICIYTQHFYKIKGVKTSSCGRRMLMKAKLTWRKATLSKRRPQQREEIVCWRKKSKGEKTEFSVMAGGDEKKEATEGTTAKILWWCTGVE